MCLPRGEECFKGEAALSQLSRVAWVTEHGSRVREGVHGGVSVVWALGCVAAILYGSLLPFDIDLTAVGAALRSGLTAIGFHPAPMEDLLTNLLVYVPLGVLVVACGDQRLASRLARVPIAILAGVGVSLLAETLQVGMSSRVASWTDCLLNGIGTSVGALIGAVTGGMVSTLLEHMKRRLAFHPFATAGLVLTVALLFYAVAPFDFVSTTDELHASFLRAKWDVMHPRAGAVGDPPLRLMVHQFMGAAWFAALGYVLALARREDGRDPGIALVSAIKHGIVLACLIEFLQLFTLSHTFDLASPILRGLAVGLGAWCGAFFTEDHREISWRDDPERALPTGLLALLVVGQIMLVMLSSVDPSTISLASFDSAGVGWIPFETVWRRPMINAVSWMLSTVIVFGTLAMSVGLLLRRIGMPGRWILAGATVLALSTTVEVLRVCGVTHFGDTTGPLLAVVSTLLAARLADFVVERDIESAALARRMHQG